MMRALALFLVSLFALTLGACTTPSSSGDAPLDATIVLERSICFGACPDYRIEIRGDGSVHYVGRRFVQVVGERDARIEPAAVRALIDQFRAADFFGLRDTYRAQVTDLPTVTLTLTLDGRTKTVVDYGGAMIDMPEAVTRLQAAVDSAAGAERWVPRTQ